jgi:hypothetical protein
MILRLADSCGPSGRAMVPADRPNRRGHAAGMSEIDELQRRIAAAFDRIGRGLDRLPSAGPGDSPKAQAPSAELAKLRTALAEEKTANAQLTERLKAVKDRDGSTNHAMEARIEVMTRQLDVQGLEMQRLRKTTIQLRDQLRALHEAAAGGADDPGMINKAMVVELEALRAARASETAEIEEILSELTPLIREAASDA